MTTKKEPGRRQLVKRGTEIAFGDITKSLTDVTERFFDTLKDIIEGEEVRPDERRYKYHEVLRETAKGVSIELTKLMNLGNERTDFVPLWRERKLPLYTNGEAEEAQRQWTQASRGANGYKMLKLPMTVPPFEQVLQAVIGEEGKDGLETGEWLKQPMLGIWMPHGIPQGEGFVDQHAEVDLRMLIRTVRNKLGAHHDDGQSNMRTPEEILGYYFRKGPTTFRNYILVAVIDAGIKAQRRAAGICREIRYPRNIEENGTAGKIPVPRDGRWSPETEITGKARGPGVQPATIEVHDPDGKKEESCRTRTVVGEKLHLEDLDTEGYYVMPAWVTFYGLRDGRHAGKQTLKAEKAKYKRWRREQGMPDKLEPSEGFKLDGTTIVVESHGYQMRIKGETMAELEDINLE